MFSSSTQCKHWMFPNEEEISCLRNDANLKFIERFKQDRTEEEIRQHFLTASEELLLLKQCEYILRDFCKKFQPPMPRSVIGTSFHYFKRFYLHNSVMDYHPKHIIVTCVYLAAKVDEFNISITQFVANVKGDREKAIDVILNNELLLMQQLNYHLTIHNPFRPVEGLLIDIKTRCQTSVNAEELRQIIEDFLDRTLFSDSCLLYAPSQIALAAIIYAASKASESLEKYLSDILFADSPREKLIYAKETAKKLIQIVRNIEPVPREQVKSIEKKLEKCRNQENNPDSAIYKKKQKELLNSDDLESEQQAGEENLLQSGSN